MQTKRILILFLTGIAFSLKAQDRISLEQCYASAEKNHPLQAQIDLLNRKTGLELTLLDKQKLPELRLDAQATYQSDVVALPVNLPQNMQIDPPNQEQWKTTFTARQLLYNGGLIHRQKNIKKATSEVQKQEIKVTIYRLKKQINQLYFSILKLDKNREILQKNSLQLEQKIQEIQHRIKRGVVPETAADPLQIKRLELRQKISSLRNSKRQLQEKLGLLTGLDMAGKHLDLPDVYISENREERPEIALFDLQKQVLTQQEQLLKKQRYPKLIAFGTGGAGNPGLNMLDNSTQAFYIVGAKLQWQIFDWNTRKTQRQALAVNREIIDNQKQIFNWKILI